MMITGSLMFGVFYTGQHGRIRTKNEALYYNMIIHFANRSGIAI